MNFLLLTSESTVISVKSLLAKYTHLEAPIFFEYASYVLLSMLLVGVVIFAVYYRKFQARVTDQTKAENALLIAEADKLEAQKSAQAKLSFLARMSHEIRTPMNGVFGMAEALSFTALDNEQTDLLDTLKGSAHNLLALLNDVLDFSKMDAGKMTLEQVPVNLSTLSNNIIGTFSHHDENKHLNFITKIDSDLNQLYLSDPTRITQILNNLISNSVKFTHEGTIKIAIDLMERKHSEESVYDTVRLSVEDSGIGIDNEKQAILFTPFVQADNDVTRKYGGTGLGLSICQEIVHALGGHIKLKSTLGRGSLFYFYLTFKQAPVAEEKVERRRRSLTVSDSTEDRFSELRVLIAEDNLINIKVLCAQLSRLNIVADVAQDGAEALMMHDKIPYDIIISDCHMPVMDGFELAKQLKSRRKEKALWVIAITADALNGSAEKCFAAGFDDYIAKPCPQKVITDKLNNAHRQVLSMQSTDYKTPPTAAIKSKKHCSQYTLFDLNALLEINDQDAILSANIAELFIHTWHQDKLSLQSAIQNKDFENVHALTHKLRGSVKYLCKDSIEKTAKELQILSQTKEVDGVKNTSKLLIKQFDLLIKEIEHWLANNPDHIF